MSRNRYANKARNEARIHGQTLRGKSKRDVSRQITRLIMAGRDDLDVNSTPADWLRSDARFNQRVANREVQTLASHGLPQSTLDKFMRLRGVEDERPGLLGHGPDHQGLASTSGAVVEVGLVGLYLGLLPRADLPDVLAPEGNDLMEGDHLPQLGH